LLTIFPGNLHPEAGGQHKDSSISARQLDLAADKPNWMQNALTSAHWMSMLIVIVWGINLQSGHPEQARTRIGGARKWSTSKPLSLAKSLQACRQLTSQPRASFTSSSLGNERDLFICKRYSATESSSSKC